MRVSPNALYAKEYNFAVCTGSPIVSQLSSYVDRPCGKDPKHLWLDIVAVVDNSKEMTDDGVLSVS